MAEEDAAKGPVLALPHLAALLLGCCIAPMGGALAFCLLLCCCIALPCPFTPGGPTGERPLLPATECTWSEATIVPRVAEDDAANLKGLGLGLGLWFNLISFNLKGPVLASPHACCLVTWLLHCTHGRRPCFLLVAMLLYCPALRLYPWRSNGAAPVAVANAKALHLPLP